MLATFINKWVYGFPRCRTCFEIWSPSSSLLNICTKYNFMWVFSFLFRVIPTLWVVEVFTLSCHLTEEDRVSLSHILLFIALVWLAEIVDMNWQHIALQLFLLCSKCNWYMYCIFNKIITLYLSCYKGFHWLIDVILFCIHKKWNEDENNVFAIPLVGC